MSDVIRATRTIGSALIPLISLLLAPDAAAASGLGVPNSERAEPDTGRVGPEVGVWVWERDTFELLDRERSWADFTSFLHRHGISTVYLYADRYRDRNILADEPDRYRRFLRHLHGEGLEVYALLGSRYLRTQEYVLPEKRAEAEAMLRRVLLYNRRAEGAASFDGINVDVEPYLLEEWDTERQRLVRLYLELSRRYREMADEHGFEGPVGPAIPFWFDGIAVEEGGETHPLSERVQDIYDFVAIMAYRDRAGGSDGIVRHVRDELEYARESGSLVRVGVETKAGDLDKVTFHEETPEEMERVLAAAAEALGGYAGFDGFVIHHYGSYREWVEARSPR